MAWGIVYFKTKDGKVSAEDFLDSCPAKIEARFHAVLEAVRDAPPPQFSGGGNWEAMHGDMGGFHEIRLTGPGRRQYRLFCVLDNADPDGLRKRGFDGPQNRGRHRDGQGLRQEVLRARLRQGQEARGSVREGAPSVHCDVSDP